MKVDVIDTLEAFQRLRPDWQRSHASDPHATVFTSWPWLAGWLEASRHPWRVLAVKAEADGGYLGFMALSSKRLAGRMGMARQEVVYLAGHPVANHTGLLAPPELETEVVSALARYFRGSRWRSLSFELTSDPRILRLGQQLQGDGVQLRQEADAQSPYLLLPESFEAYLSEHFSGKAQRELRRRQRKAQALGLRLTQVERSSELAEHFAAFAAVHEQRFGPIQPRHRAMYERIFARMLEAEALHFQVLWDGDRPAAAQIGFVDAKHGVYHGCQGGWDARYGELAPGLLIKLEAIRYAVERGLGAFDLGRGAHEYKDGLGARPFATQRVRLTRLSVAQRLKRKLVGGRLGQVGEPGDEAQG